MGGILLGKQKHMYTRGYVTGQRALSGMRVWEIHRVRFLFGRELSQAHDDAIHVPGLVEEGHYH